ncbi:MAG: carbon-nitrogen hydrolase family protein [Caldilineaceae bacterium]|nr:carbon-nitrogen hydrolase family protein [Caldilineaceae bacterium]
MSTFVIAACQMNSRDDKDANLATAERLIDEAALMGAQMVGLPEMFNFLATDDKMAEGAEAIDGPTAQFLRRKAQQHRIYLHGGSIPMLIPGSDRIYNTTLVFDPTGEQIASDNKLHLFDIHVEGQSSYKESTRVAPGNQMVTFETEHAQMGLTICYDIRFPELYRALTLAGAKVIFQPAAFTLYTGKDHWEVLIRARAIENQVYMVSPAQIGTHGNGKQCYGSTMIVDPWGSILARAPERECVVVAEVDLAAQEKTRAGLPSLQHRRVDVYG